MKKITIGFSIHRPEIIGLTADLMQAHEALFLEEPPQAGFQQMLAGALSVEEYLLPVDIEYPVFSRQMCRLLRKMHAEGKKIFQVEPFLQHLLTVHEFFAQGHRPEELAAGSPEEQVYTAERDATRALLDYYQIVIKGTFEETIEAVMRFARADAARFRLRDVLRARALAEAITRYASAFIEAGSIHYGLYLQLKKKLTKHVHIKPVFIAHKALQTIGERGHLYGPGDQLTLSYILHANSKDTQADALLAARSLVYSKLVQKEELSADLETFPHIRNELACIQTVQRLTLGDCKRLFPLLRRTKSVNVRHVVEDYLVRFKKQLLPTIIDLSN
ncbi:MAG: hypothetical protein PVF29_00115 [Desulfobacterales bacterium]|jgi:hypothetical protein